jgi:N-acetylglutamate synthase-like GNAT family acetyltransferase
VPRVLLRSAVPADLADLSYPQFLPWRTRLIAAEIDGRVIGVGGLVFRPDGVWASIALTDEARRYKLAMHRAALMTLDMARKMGVRRLLATAEEGREGARMWLERLGFTERDGLWELHVER